MKGKIAVVTGADGQLGRAFVEALQKAGATVIPTDIGDMDVTKEASIKDKLYTILAKYGRVDILVNNAGVAVFTPFEERTEEEIDKVLDVNVKGTILCSKVFGNQMIKQNGGCIINIASVYGVVSADHRIYGKSGRNSSEVYGASKAAVIHLTKYLATYMARYNINVNCISPGGVFNHQDGEFIKNYEAKTPLGRMCLENDLIWAVLFLASNPSYITGQNIVVDGGFSLW